MPQLRRKPVRAVLRRKSSVPVWVSIGWRVIFVIGLILVAVLVHWFERDGLIDHIDGHVSFSDVVYFTMISVTTTGYGDIAPVTTQARLFDALVVTPIRVFVILVFVGTAYRFIIRRTWEKWRMSVIQKNLSGHLIVAGYGTTGSQAVDELIARGMPASRIVVIDCDDETLKRAESLGCPVLEADATRDSVLQAVRIERAKSVIISAGSDDASILITLTARHLAPEIPISISVRNADNELIARQAGATTVINPVSFAGLLLAGSSEGPHIADYIADLATTHGRVQLSERRVRPDECGKPLSAIAVGMGVRVYRNDLPYGFWEPEAQSLMPGDTIVEILPTSKTEADNGAS